MLGPLWKRLGAQGKNQFLSKHLSNPNVNCPIWNNNIDQFKKNLKELFIKVPFLVHYFM